MSMTKLASKISKIEGKKHQASIGDIREILKILTTLCAENSLNLDVLHADIIKKMEKKHNQHIILATSWSFKDKPKNKKK